MKKVAYLFNQYPSVSHASMRREMNALESRGLEIHRFSIREARHGVVDREDAPEVDTTTILLNRPFQLVWHVLLTLMRAPVKSMLAVASCASAAWTTSFGLRHIAYLAEAASLLHRCRARGLTHVHAHFGTNAATVARYARRLGGPTYSFTIHGPDEWDRPFDFQLVEKVVDSKFVVCICHYTSSQLRRLLPQEYWDRIVIVRCGVDRQFLEWSGDANHGQSNTLVFVGRLSPQKGVSVLLEAARRAFATHPQARLQLCGDGELRESVEAQIAEAGLAGRIEITGWLDGPQVRKHIRNGRALVMSSFAEGLPMVIMEAFAVSRPVIATFVAGIPELVEHGRSGWLVPAGDVEALAAAMRACLDADESLLREFAERGRSEVRDRHDIAKAVEPLFERIVV